jgi:hypothetical protein
MGWEPQQAFLPTDGLAYPTVSCPPILLESSESLQLANVIIINESIGSKQTYTNMVWGGQQGGHKTAVWMHTNTRNY